MTWKDRLPDVVERLGKGETLDSIGNTYGVSKQRMYQVLSKYGISTPKRRVRNILRDKPPKYHWLSMLLTNKGIRGEEKVRLVESCVVPDVCPILGIELNYDGSGKEGYSRDDSSPSIDKIVPSLGYTEGNIHIISWRANRIKNDGTWEELIAIGEYIRDLTS